MYKNNDQRILTLQKRVARCCCGSCGSPLVIKHIRFNDIPDVKTEIFCSACNCIEYGVEKEIFQCAKQFVEETDFNYYSYLDTSEMTQKMNVAKVSDLLTWFLQKLSLLDEEGLKVPIEYDASSTGSYIEINDMQLLRLLERIKDE